MAKSDHPLLQSAAIDYWNLLHDTVAACQSADTTEADVLRRAAVAWSTVYGIARLTTFAQIPTSVATTAETLVHDALNQLLAAWQRI